MSGPLAALPLHLVCQLMVTGSPQTSNVNFVVGDATTSSPGICPACPSSPPPTTLPEGYIVYPDIGAAYKVHDKSVSWLEARKLCIDEGAQLALIDSVTKLEYVNRNGRSDGFTHVGIHSLFNKGDWVSVRTGASLTSLPWAPGEPSSNLDCVMISFGRHGLENYGCSFMPAEFVCEILLPSDNEVRVNEQQRIERTTSSWSGDKVTGRTTPWPWPSDSTTSNYYYDTYNSG